METWDFEKPPMLIRDAQKLEAHAMQIIPVTITCTSVSYGIEPTVWFILERCGLWEVVEHGGEEAIFAATIDGAELSRKVSQVMAGIKLTDAQTKDPWNKDTLLFGEDGIMSMQSRDACRAGMHASH